MKCPNCSNDVEPSADQIVAVAGVAISFPVLAAPYIATMIAVPYLAPVFIAGILWNSFRKKTCPNCGHRFTFFQEGKQ
jgi:DNA-directed RNA polymerase subunit RPC12/RpoP